MVGHSAGGHLASLLVLRSLAAAASFADLPIPALGIKGVVTLGSPFDIRFVCIVTRVLLLLLLFFFSPLSCQMVGGEGLGADKDACR